MENKFQFYNTLTRKVETVIPHEDGERSANFERGSRSVTGIIRIKRNGEYQSGE